MLSPVILGTFIFLSPLTIPLLKEEIEANRNGKTAREEQLVKDRKAREAQLQTLLRQIFQETELKPAIETLVEKAKENSVSSTDLQLKTAQQNRYLVLPTSQYFTINMPDKRLIYSSSRENISIPINFKAPYPRKEDVVENFEKSSVKFLPDSEIRFGIIGNVRYLPEGFHEHIEITRCSINYRDNFAYKEVSCSGVRTWR